MSKSEVMDGFDNSPSSVFSVEALQNTRDALRDTSTPPFLKTETAIMPAWWARYIGIDVDEKLDCLISLSAETVLRAIMTMK